MSRIEKLWVPEGHLLGLRMNLGGVARTVYWRVVGRAPANYPHAFVSANPNTAVGWTDLQQAVTNIHVLEPREQSIIHQFFVGIYPSDALFYLQYPFNIDQNAITGNRQADGAGIGAISGYQSPYRDPAPETEFFTISGLRPGVNVFNTNGFAQTPELYFYAMMYRVEGPFLADDPAVGGPRRAMELVDAGQARVASLYGTVLANMPDWLARIVGEKVAAQTVNGRVA